MVWDTIHAITHLMGDCTPVVVVERPAACDLVESFLNDPTARHNRARAVNAIVSGRWRELARELGVSDDELECFDQWPERDAVLAQAWAAMADASAADALGFVLHAEGPTRIELGEG